MATVELLLRDRRHNKTVVFACKTSSQPNSTSLELGASLTQNETKVFERKQILKQDKDRTKIRRCFFVLKMGFREFNGSLLVRDKNGCPKTKCKQQKQFEAYTA